MLVFKILHQDEWDALREAGQTLGAPIDLMDGYVHLSSAEQVAETAAKYFAGVDDLWLLAVDTDVLGTDLRWEPSRGGALFPHLYRELRMNDVVWHRPLPLESGSHRFPDLSSPPTPP